MNQLHTASIIVAPPDSCPNCLNPNNPPHRTQTASNQEITGHYQCPTCHYTWNQAWKAEILT